MVNACLLAMEINSLLPLHETPRDTEGYEGFYHLIELNGTVDTYEWRLWTCYSKLYRPRP